MVFRSIRDDYQLDEQSKKLCVDRNPLWNHIPDLERLDC